MNEEPVLLKIIFGFVILVAVVSFFANMFKFYRSLGTEHAAGNLTAMLASFAVIYVGTCIYGKL
jgi:hypothetical protein